MESREFEMLLGRLQPDGSRKPGVVDKFLRDSAQLISFVANHAERQGLYEDAVRLYDLGKVRGRGRGRCSTPLPALLHCRTMGRCWQ